MAIACSACGGAPPHLAPYTGGDRQLFDDRIDPLAVGNVNARSPWDPLLGRRAQQADSVARMRVSTVTTIALGGQQRTYRVTLVFVGKPLAQHIPSYEPQLDLAIRPGSPSFDIVTWLDARLIGKTFIGFVRQFAGPEEPEMHFHLSANNLDVAAAARHGTTFDEMPGP
jgi:hypothetical protein